MKIDKIRIFQDFHDFFFFKSKKKKYVKVKFYLLQRS